MSRFINIYCFFLAFFFGGCFLVEDLSPDPACVNVVDINIPYDVDSAWATVICNDSIVFSNENGEMFGYPDLIWGRKIEYRNREGGTLFWLNVGEDYPLWQGKDEINCKLDMDVFCDNKKYPFVEYEWTFHQKNRHLYSFNRWSEDIGVYSIPIKNDVCGNKNRYAVEILTPRDSNCAEK